MAPIHTGAEKVYPSGPYLSFLFAWFISDFPLSRWVVWPLDFIVGSFPDARPTNYLNIYQKFSRKLKIDSLQQLSEIWFKFLLQVSQSKELKQSQGNASWTDILKWLPWHLWGWIQRLCTSLNKSPVYYWSLCMVGLPAHGGWEENKKGFWMTWPICKHLLVKT